MENSFSKIFYPVGAHESGLIGKNPMGKTNNIYSRITKVAIGKISEIKIFGQDWPTLMEQEYMLWILQKDTYPH